MKKENMKKIIRPSFLASLTALTLAKPAFAKQFFYTFTVL